MVDEHLVEILKRKLQQLTVGDYHGLISLGLTCYLNSVLQVLFMTIDFRDAVKRCCSKNSTIDLHLKELFVRLEKRMAGTFKITQELGIKDLYEQCDAAEYFEKILCQTSSEASKIFKGQLNHQITCCRCDRRTNSRSFFWLLPLTVENSPCITYQVNQGLEAFFQTQTVCGDNQLYCDNCGRKENAKIAYEMMQHPDVLTLLLKKFTFDDRLKRYVKLHCNADVPQTLSVEKKTYHLYAIVNHFGSLTGGHYTAEIRSFETGQWYCFNDRTVKTITLFKPGEHCLRSSSAYLLLYRKVSRHPEKPGENHLEARSGHSHADTEGRCAEVERRETPVYPCLPESGSWRGKDHLNHVKPIILKRNDDDTVWRDQTNSGELGKQIHGVKKMKLLHRNKGADGHKMKCMCDANNKATPAQFMRTNRVNN
ncbi:ubiquitin carboxyl-terminal hydrolase 50-like isoform 2-T2 [Pholidichthys leucotaenia]